MATALSSLSLTQLKRAVEIKEQIENLQNEIDQILGTPSPSPARMPRANGASRGRGLFRPRRKQVSAAGRARIAAAARLRWARRKAAAGVPVSVAAPRRRRRISAAGRAKLAAAARARWARVKAAGRSAL